MFRNREDAGLQLAEKLKARHLVRPLVLAIPRGGIVIGAILARELNAELDVVLAQKLRAREQPDRAIGAITDDGFMVFDPLGEDDHCTSEGHLVEERRHQLTEMARREQMIRGICAKAPIADRSIIVTDDGIATGSSMIAALQAIRVQKPREVIVAVPLVSAERSKFIREWCDDLVTLTCPKLVASIGQHYEDFRQVVDNEVLQLLKERGCLPGRSTSGPDLASASSGSRQLK